MKSDFESEILKNLSEKDILNLVLSFATNNTNISMVTVDIFSKEYELYVKQRLSAASLKSIKLSLKHLLRILFPELS